MQNLLLVAVAGLVIGAIYSLAGMGIVLVKRVTGVVNLAQGEFYVIGALTAATGLASGLPAVLAVALGVTAAAVLGAFEEVALLRRMKGASTAVLLLATVAFAITLSGAEMLLWGRDPRTIGDFVPGGVLSLGGVQLQAQGALLIAVTIALGVGLHLFIEKTGAGHAMTAVAEDPVGAYITGLNVSRLRLVGLLLAGALGGLAGAVALPLVLVDFTMGLGIALKGLIASMLGGDSIRGAMVAGLAVGALESVTVRYGSDLYRDVVVFGVLVVAIVALPWLTAVKTRRGIVA